MPLVTFTAGDIIRSDDIDSNYAICVLTDTAKTVTVTHTWTASQTFTGGWTSAAACTITSASATAFAVGLTGATNSAFLVDASTGSQVAGLKVTGAATGGTVAVVTIDSGADTNLIVNAKGVGTIGIGSVSTGRVTITPVTTITGSLTLSAALIYGGVTLSNAVTGTGNMVLSAGPTLTGTIVLTGTTITGAPTWSSNQAITLSTAAQPNVTSVGALTGFTISNSMTNAAGDLDIDAKTGGANAVRINRSGGTGGFSVFAGGTLTSNLTITDAGVVTFRAGVSGITTLAGTGAISGFTSAAFSSTISTTNGALNVDLDTPTQAGLATFTNRSVTIPSGLTSVRVAGANVVVATEMGAASETSRLFLFTSANGQTAAAPRIVFVGNEGSFASPAASANGADLGVVDFGGYGNAFTTTSGAAIAATTTQLWTGSAQGTKLQFTTTANGATTRALALTLDQDKSATFGSSITTSAPSGGTAAAWKLGTVSVTSPTSPNRTIELDVAGTIYYLAAKTTNN